MNSNFSTLDYAIFITYAVLIVGVGLWVSRSKGKEKTSEDYFLAGKSLPWWAIGASLIAANISAEQFIGMSGSGFAIGLAIASYEWMAAITLLVVGKFFLPVFIKNDLFTIPEYVEKRFSENMKTILAVFWISLFIFVNLTSVLFLGGKALDTIMGVGDGSILTLCIVGLAVIAAAYSLWGGLTAVAWTDVIQVALLIFGGLITAFIALTKVSPDGGIISGFVHLYEVVPEKFSMILEQGEVITPNGKDAWWDLPGLAVLIGGIWIANLYYWGFNQYIIQRTLAAKSIKEAQKGIVFAAYLKLLIPLLVVVPGIIAYVLNSNEAGEITQQTIDASFVGEDGNILNDNAAPWLISSFIPVGLKGLVVAALAAAIVSSLASMLNSTSTIFTMDIYKPYINKNASNKQMVTTGRITAAVALLIAVFIAPQLKNLGQVFQYIQEYTGVVSPGILAVFMAGLFWKPATNKGAIAGALASIPIALFFKIGPNQWASGDIFVVLPFMHQMGLTFLLSLAVIVGVSLLDKKNIGVGNTIVVSKDIFQTEKIFNVHSVVIIVILVALYGLFW